MWVHRYTRIRPWIGIKLVKINCRCNSIGTFNGEMRKSCKVIEEHEYVNMSGELLLLNQEENIKRKCSTEKN